MNEAINKVLDLIEERLTREIGIKDLTKTAYMSTAVLYRVFSLSVSMPVFTYVRRRRLSEAVGEILGGDNRILDIALKYGYESHEAFARAVRQQFGASPSRLTPDLVRKGTQRRIQMAIEDIINGDFAVESLPTFGAASCHVTGIKPEIRSGAALAKWAELRGLPTASGQARYFGFDNPDAGSPEEERLGHGYEHWLVLPDDWTQKDIGKDSLVSFTRFPGSRYATVETTVMHVGEAWKALCRWTTEHGHRIAEGRCLEETVSANADEMSIKLKLYLPVAPQGG